MERSGVQQVVTKADYCSHPRRISLKESAIVAFPPRLERARQNPEQNLRSRPDAEHIESATNR